MERYSHLQAMPNSPLTPLTPLSENTKFEFNFGGDGSLDMYINSVRQEHRVEQQQKKLLQYANRTFHKKGYTLQPKRNSEEFLKIRDIFEAQELIQGQNRVKQRNCCQDKQHQPDHYNATPKTPVVKITYTGTTPTPKKSNQVLRANYATTPPNVRTPLKLKNNNVPQNLNSKCFSVQQKQKLQQKYIMQQQRQTIKPNQNRIFHQASPVALKPLCPQVASILQRSGLASYCGLFQKEEIDLFTFNLLKLQDLQQIGIRNQKHCALLMREISYAGQYI